MSLEAFVRAAIMIVQLDQVLAAQHKSLINTDKVLGVLLDVNTTSQTLGPTQALPANVPPSTLSLLALQFWRHVHASDNVELRGTKYFALIQDHTQQGHFVLVLRLAVLRVRRYTEANVTWPTRKAVHLSRLSQGTQIPQTLLGKRKAALTCFLQ